MKRPKTKISSTLILQNSFKGIPVCRDTTIPSFCRILFCVFIFAFFLFTSPGCPTQPDDNGKTNLPDTTSHNFTWQKFTFGGDAGSCNLYDVAIIDENNIWAVGAIYLKDSTGQPDPEQYAVAHWDGNSWQLMKLRFNCRLYYPNCGPETRLITSGNSIFARSKDDIWIAGSSIHHYDGSKWTEEAGILGAGNANAIWGNEKELWFVGNNGFVAYRSSNGTWNKLESGTETDIYDVWGTKDDKVVMFTGYQEIYKITNSNNIEKILIPLNRRIRSVWFNSLEKIYAAGDGIFSSTDIVHWKEEDITNEFATFRIRGKTSNDVFATGGFGFTAHFNGKTWKALEEASLQSGNYYSLDVEEDIVVLVGSNGAQALITIGRRQ